MGKAERSRIRAAAQADPDGDEKQHAVDAEHVDRKRDKDTTTDRNGHDDRDDDRARTTRALTTRARTSRATTSRVTTSRATTSRVTTSRATTSGRRRPGRRRPGPPQERRGQEHRRQEGQDDKDRDRSGDGDDRAAGRTHDAARDTRSDVQNLADNRLTEPDPGESADHDRPGDRSDGSHRHDRPGREPQPRPADQPESDLRTATPVPAPGTPTTTPRSTKPRDRRRTDGLTNFGAAASGGCGRPEHAGPP